MDSNTNNNAKIFLGSEIINLFETMIESHRALITIGMIFNAFDFEKKNGNAFQGKIQKTWFKSIIDEMISTQFEKMTQIVDQYKEEQSKL